MFCGYYDFIEFFLPETKNIPIEGMCGVWKQHWFWRKFIPEDDHRALYLVVLDNLLANILSSC
jgi:hypothetical protein